MKKFLIVVLPFLVLSLILGVCFYYSFTEHESYSSLEDDFVVNRPYLSVAKSLATKDSLEKTIEDSDGRLKYKNWSNFTVEAPKRLLKLKEYKLDGKLNFGVEKNDESLGKLNLEFEQNVEINKDIFHIKTSLAKPQKNVLLCDKNIEIIPLENSQVEIKIKSELKVKRSIPYFLKDFMDKKVEENNTKSLEQLKHNLLNITNDASPVINFKRNFE